ncbi:MULTISPECIES: MFS transporter [Micrococcaceae]|uniref:MFS transporter n=1 Tax=Micrococcaceae TaxID=1268 RepID=UPI000CFAB233|nr:MULTISPECIES: MFS transporter [unclassified Arthrobacter]PQZ86472.1 MFS transporter [Arthrobacter sp. MYb222]PRB77854.1 MFS transporter [Arthrobacter sp. MYb214]TDU22424.1 MHS family proline/betaine transporter-like MFS transporter [Arthrobacter sp. JUb115]
MENQQLPVKDQTAPARRQSTARGIAAATIGNALEWYDMAIYALLAIYIGHNFFPSENPAVEVIQAFAVFGISYLIRPLGGLVLGSYADRKGLKKGLILTIRLMVVGTAIIALLPGYDTIGIFAPLGLILGRLIQGFSAGGEFGAATSYLLAQDKGRKGFLGSFQFASQGLGAMMAAITVVALTSIFTTEQMNDWAWRIPFFIGLLVGPAGWWIRRHVDEAPLPEAAPGDRHSAKNAVHAPVRELFRSNKASVFIAGGALAISTALNFVLQYMPTFGISQLGMSPTVSFSSLIISGAILTFATPVVGHLSDRFGRLRIMIPAALAIMLLTIPLFLWLIAGKTFLVLAVVMVILGLLKALYFGALPSVMADVFSDSSRATGLSFSYNTSVAIFGGFTPMICAFLIEATGQPIAPGYYLAVLAIVSIAALGSAFRFRAVR